MAVSIDLYIPFNLITISIVGFFGISGLSLLVVVLLL